MVNIKRPKSTARSKVGAVKGQRTGPAGSAEHKVIKAPAVVGAPITYGRRIEKRPGTGRKESPSMGQDGGTLIVRCGHHELGMTLNLPHVDPEPRVRVEVDRAACLT